MATLRASKVVASLPATLEADTIYFIRVGEGFDISVTDETGLIAYSLNSVDLNELGDELTTLKPNPVGTDRVIGLDSANSFLPVLIEIQNLPSGGSGINYAVSSTAPDPNTTPLWFDLTGSAYFWDGEFWVEVIGKRGPAGADGTGGGALDDDSVTNAKLANVASQTIKGRVTGGAGDPEDLTPEQVRTLLNVEDGATANSPDAALVARSNHTGTQVSSTISDFDEATRGQIEDALVAGSGITITPSGSGANRQLTLSAAGGGGADPLTLSTTSPSTPPSGSVTVFGRNIAGRMMPSFIGPSGLDSALQPLLARNKIAWANPLGNSTGINYMGMTLTATGTATRADVATTNIHTAIKRLEYAVTTAAATAVAGFRYSVLQYHIGDTSTPYGGFFFVCRFGPSGGSTVATKRGWCGLSSITAAPTDVEPSTTRTNAIGVCHDAADTNWHIVHRAGTAAATKIDTGIPKDPANNSEMYELAMFTAPTGTPSVSFRFTRLSDNTFFEHTATTNLPSVTQLLAPSAYMSVGGTSSVIGISLASMYIETDF